MFLNSLTINNYRKFGESNNNTNNTIFFVNGNEIIHSSDNEDERGNTSISPSSTLIIGKNNAGKTTITNALSFIVDETNRLPKSSDFNVNYLIEIIKKYKEFNAEEDNYEDLPIPELEFILKIKLNSNEKDLVTNLSNFITLKNHDLNEPIEIKVLYELEDEQLFRNKLMEIIKEDDINICIEKVCNLIDDKEIIKYKKIYKNFNGNIVDSFNLKNLISIKNIKANRYLNEHVLSDVFKKIILSLFDSKSSKDELNEFATKVNESITKTVEGTSKTVSNILKEIESKNHVDMNLSGNVTRDVFFKNLIKYRFIDGEHFIPEDQFGLGYVNLLNIIGEIVHYIDTYEEKSHESRINLLFIEEPEIFMHPQMQEFFITRIDNAVQKALEGVKGQNKKILQCQIIITTHSSHIVNSKIHSSNSFNNINYITIEDRKSIVIPLDDKTILKDNDNDNEADLLFLKKHIKYKVSELFFSDAIIFVEGATEETLLNYFLEKNDDLKNYYISVFRIDGAHSKVYWPLIEKLKIPCLIITDLDIKREPCEKNESHKQDEKNKEDNKKCSVCNGDEQKKSYSQIDSLDGRTTTNSTLITFLKNVPGKSDEGYLSGKLEYKKSDNLFIVYQKEPIESYFATSLEEAIILSNYQNKILHDVMREIKPNVYKAITDDGKKIEQLKDNSFKLQQKISNDNKKSAFVSKLLYKMITSDKAEQIKLPQYIQDGFSWLVRELKKKG